ncbi:MAG TPA: cysteine synthase A [Prolixibacteraceae bacterium]|nr:cysteine synthase A [Prolixibacteraceae bacterium]HPR60098.1 cysteine synthase A [Prolixibacteraceae bacterium]
MSKVNNISQLIGATPLVKLNRLTQGVEADVYVKLESMNPGGSVKDRLAYAMITAAERDGLIDAETTIIEPTSGNTGIGLAMMCAIKSYKLILVMPESMSPERRAILKAYGAQLYLTPATGGMKASIAKANELASQIEKSFIPMQFENEANVDFHRKTTAPEIWADTEGKIDIFVAGAGTGGTITGVGEELKKLKPTFKAVVVEPADSPVISGGNPGSHKIQGIGAGFIPKILNTNIIDEVFTVANDVAFDTARRLTLEEGIFSGISSGANVYAAIEIAKRPENKGKTIVTIVCDTGERYLSTPLYNNDETN